MKKRLFTLALCIIMAFTMGMSAFAESSSFATFPTEDSPESTADPRYVPCPGGGRHRMKNKGFAYVYAGSYDNPGELLMNGGQCSQCTQCHLALASDINPVTDPGRGLGRYAIWYCNYSLPVGPTIFYGGLHGSYYGSLMDDPFWSGFEFYN